MALYRYDVVYIKKCHGVEQSLTFHINFAYQLLLMGSIHKKGVLYGIIDIISGFN